MSTGTVVYVAGAKDLAGTVNVTAWITKAGLDPEWTEMAGLPPFTGDPQKAALDLIRKGAVGVNLVCACVDSEGTIHLQPDARRIA